MSKVQKKHSNFFILERTDQYEESDSVKNVYDLSILDKIKELEDSNYDNKTQNKENNFNTQNKKLNKEAKRIKINHEKKSEIIKIVKKMILSGNLIYNWRITKTKEILIFLHLSIIMIGIISFIKDPIKQKHIIIEDIIPNITKNTTESNSTKNFDKTINYFFKKSGKIELIYREIILHIFLIPVWIILYYKVIPKWKKINDMIYRFSNYILLHESNKSRNYFYYLMDNYSILVTQKNYLQSYKNSPNNNNFLPIPPHLTITPNNNCIFLYCINIIIDYFTDDNLTPAYFTLIPDDDSEIITLLLKQINYEFTEKIMQYIKKFILPTILCFNWAFLFNKLSDLLASFVFIACLINWVIVSYIGKEYYISIKKNIDFYIDNYNNSLLPKGKFIYRKNKLIMVLTLNKNTYRKQEVISSIEKIL